jgi:7-cyano-7-deazaguanine synthase
MKAPDTSKAVVLLSGGLDSSTLVAIVKAEGYEIHALSFNYNQRHLRELESAKMVAEAFHIKRHLTVNFDLRDIGGSALTTDIEVPKKGRKQKTSASSAMPLEAKRLRRAQSGRQKATGIGNINLNSESRVPHPDIPVTYVPARNTIFLAFALAWAEVLKAENIFIGANAIDYSGYPDCRHEYIKAFESLANLATKASVEGKLKFTIRAPLISMKKAEIITKGFELGLDYSLTWSCYDPLPEQGLRAKEKGQNAKKSLRKNTTNHKLQTSYVPCGICDSCILRQKGFAEAGISDPLLSLI